MKLRREFLLYIAVFAALLLSLYLLMVLFAAIPNAAITNNIFDSANYFVNADPYVFSEDGQHQNIADNYADQIWTNIGWNMGRGNPFRSVLDTKYYDGEQYASSAGLYLAITRDMEANTDYTRYWHGTASLIRFLHLFTNVHGIKNIGMVCLLLLIAQTVLILCRMDYWDLGLAVLISLICVQFWNLRLSIEYLPCFLISFGLCPAFLRLEKKGNAHLNILSVVSGTLTAFFDFLTTETVTILIPLILIIAIRSRERRLHSPRKVLKLLAGCCLSWLAAYAGTFAIKWIAVSLATGKNHLLVAIHAAGNRINGAVPQEMQKTPGIFLAIGANFSAMFEGTSRADIQQAISGLIVVIMLLMMIYLLYKVRSKPYPGTGFLLLLGCVVLLRFGILVNHSYMHAFFTYRALASTILAVLAALVINLRPVKQKGYLSESKRQA